MNFTEEITQFAKRIESIKGKILTEEATKTSIILPFFQLLGYDVFNPSEFVPEFTADAGTKKGEKVDYAIVINDEPLILIEAKSANTTLDSRHMNQLLRYFTVTKARFAILTNGIVYKFYSDLEEANKMDAMPFLEINMTKMKKESINQLSYFKKENFNVRNILSNASDLKYTLMIKNAIEEQFEFPSDQLVKVLIGKSIYKGVKTQSVIDKFREITKKAFNEYVNEIINERLNNAIIAEDAPPKQNEFFVSNEEKSVLDYVKKIIGKEDNFIYKKTTRYAYMQLETSTRWICRVYIRKGESLFTLHKFDDTDYECEYFFDSLEQLMQISDLIKDVYERCKKI